METMRMDRLTHRFRRFAVSVIHLIHSHALQ